MNTKCKLVTVFLALLFTASCRKEEAYLIKVYKGDVDEVGVECGYVSPQGDTLIPVGKYHYCYTDTLRELAIVLKKDGQLIGIDRNEHPLFEVFWFDNGPDPVVEGLFRIKKSGKIGYANQKGEIVNVPQYACAFPFENGKAKVAEDCVVVPEGEHSGWESKKWMYIDKKGNKMKE